LGQTDVINPVGYRPDLKGMEEVEKEIQQREMITKNFEDRVTWVKDS
jgi:hypothetical protein